MNVAGASGKFISVGSQDDTAAYEFSDADGTIDQSIELSDGLLLIDGTTEHTLSNAEFFVIQVN